MVLSLCASDWGWIDRHQLCWGCKETPHKTDNKPVMSGLGGEPHILKKGLKGYLFPHLSEPHLHAHVFFSCRVWMKCNLCHWFIEGKQCLKKKHLNVYINKN